ncbi:sensor histidine kinase [Streptomyces zagrosensis]|uniref:histidine kinase n=1 Tax=Streptomyces zagrosensis TaxID=1042984 RepID=A0A7W9V318_9ACTN|nr:histidine kinase [Streptomyces zagrosensis]MBB5939434.1 signal transduction histidine kinase [Streptomyces zagrosensis]
MSAIPPPPRFKQVPPSVWVALAWWAGTALTLLMRVRLPGEGEAAERIGAPLVQWEGWISLAVASALTLVGGGLLHRRPLTALCLLLTAAATAPIALSVGEIPLLQFLAVDVAVCFIAATRPRATGIVAAALSLAVLAGYLATRTLLGWHVGTSTELLVAMTTVIAWLIGNSAHQATKYAEKLGAQVAAQAVTAERLRIARELHDMVAHSIGVVALQAGAARRVIDSQPAAARDALSAIETTGRETLSGLRRMLGALRQAAEPDQQPPDSTTHQQATHAAGEAAYRAGARAADEGPDGADREAVGGAATGLGPGLAAIERLAATTTAAGVQVEVRWRGVPRPLPPEIDMSAYRIVQEAVTNVVRHAGTRSCRVAIDCQPDALAIEVIDGEDVTVSGAGEVSEAGMCSAGRGDRHGDRRGDGRAGFPRLFSAHEHGRAPGAGHGYGLLGMRERVGLLHGEFSAQSRPGGGFRVLARLPLPAPAKPLSAPAQPIPAKSPPAQPTLAAARTAAVTR